MPTCLSSSLTSTQTQQAPVLLSFSCQDAVKQPLAAIVSTRKQQRCSCNDCLLSTCVLCACLLQVPAIPGPLAEQNARVYRRYAALQQVLSLGHAAVSAETGVLLLSDPMPILQQHPTDVTVMSTASGDEHSAYGECRSSASTAASMLCLF